MFTDTHTHLYDDRLSDDKQDEMIQRAFDAGVSKMYMPNCDQHTIPGMMRIAKAFPGKCLPMIGLHPTYVNEDFQTELNIIRDWLTKDGFVAVGEIGLDYYWDLKYVDLQKKCFEQQIDWALEHELPIVIHSREAIADCIDIVRRKQNGKLSGVFHCFSGTLDEAKEIINTGFFLGIGGSITYKANKNLQEAIQQIPLEHILLETDAPYLAPVPYRGKRNESSYIPLIAEKIAELQGISIEMVAEVTTKNAQRLFRK